MIKKKVILLLTCVALALPIGGVSAADVKHDNVAVVISNNTSSKDVKIATQNVEGEILNIRDTKNGIMLSMEDINISIDDKSEIINEFDGKKLTKNDLKKGMKIRAYYGPAVTLSIPPMSYGRKIIVSQESENIGAVEQNIGSIVELNNKKNGKNAYIKSKDGSAFTFITEKTEIVNGEGKKVSIEDLKEWNKIRIYFDKKDGIIDFKGFVTTVYIPEKIVVLDKVEKDLLATQGKITSLTDSKAGGTILLEGKKATEFGYDVIKLNINENTKIIDVKNKKQLSYKDLKEGTEIVAYYGGAVTRSMPAIGNCMEIIVLQ
ncbi:hypothetical protein KQI86_09425 [Clostridium sp. MSJ-11]|uniref:Uncharacterized protein n=1 Tax=Clostridium mobile TaxID=2841512 RepID=A0ABS6EHS2_9CLOT|nr:hypothetical protein [Clostridium mobile]MBU5484550.1 hypothetical protein [Clostridium mobile]